MLADEPTSQLDEATAGVVIDLLAEAHGRGATVVVASHDSRLARRATTTVALAAGRLVAPAARA